MYTLFFFYFPHTEESWRLQRTASKAKRDRWMVERKRERERLCPCTAIYIYSRGSGLLSQTMLLERRPRYQHYTRCVRRLTYNLIVLYFLLLFFFCPFGRFADPILSFTVIYSHVSLSISHRQKFFNSFLLFLFFFCLFGWFLLSFGVLCVLFCMDLC